VSPRRRIDLSLYLVAGSDVVPERSLRDVVLAAVSNGVTAVQLRQKQGSTRGFIEEARALIMVLRPLAIPLIINDRVDVALAAGADGVHVGQTDMDPRDARRLIGDARLLGLSVTNLAEARVVDAAIVDYVGVGPVFATPSKLDAAPPLGVSGTSEICAVLRIPAVAIGGITCANAGDVLSAGVDGLAVISAICGAERPDEAAAALAKQVLAARARRAERRVS